MLPSTQVGGSVEDACRREGKCPGRGGGAFPIKGIIQTDAAINPAGWKCVVGAGAARGGVCWTVPGGISVFQGCHSVLA